MLVLEFIFFPLCVLAADFPTFKVKPLHSVYLVGENVNLTCCATNSSLIRSFQFYKEGKVIHSTEGSPGSCTVYNPKSLSNQDAGSYQCRYQRIKNQTHTESVMSEKVILKITDRPATPTISLDPFHPVYISGENVSLICSIPGGSTAKEIQFYKNNHKLHKQQRSKSSVSYLISTSAQEAAADYSCTYWISNAEREIQSQPSSYVTVTAIDRPATPTISLDPFHPVYISGENVSLICSIPGGSTAKGIEFYKNNHKLHKQQRSKSSVSYLISTSAQEAAADYSCTYWISNAEREIESQPSSYVTVTAIDRPATPTISLDPFHPVYISGENVSLICSIPGGSTAKEIQFYKNNHKLHKQQRSKSSVSYLISTSAQEAAADYSCTYWISNAEREIESQPSSYVKVTAINRPPAPLISLNPSYPVYIKGENISMICYITDSFAVEGFQYFKDEQKIHRQVTTSKTATYITSTSVQEVAAKYFCGYLINHANREIESQPSSHFPVIIIEPPPPPTLQLIPKYNVYITGETINSLCIGGSNNFQYILYKDGQLLMYSKNISFSLANIQIKSSGIYTCTFHTYIQERLVESNRSEPVNLTVIDRPPAPLISLNPSYPVYIKGENISMICCLTGGFAVEGFQYYKNDRIIHGEFTTNKTATYITSTYFQEVATKYFCGYWIKHANRDIESQPSSHFSVTVIDPLLSPHLQDKSGLPIYLLGDNLKLLCTASSQYNVTYFHIYLEEEEVISLRLKAQSSLSHGVSSISRSSSGSYSCQFQANVLGRDIFSPKSSSLLITLTEPPPPPTLHLIPKYNVYITGETINSLCIGGSNNVQYILYKDGQFLMNSKDISFSLANIQIKSSGIYTCTFHTYIQERLVESNRSEPVNLTVIDPIPAPLLILGSPVQKVKDGFQVILNCSVPDYSVQRTFHFFKITAEYDHSPSSKNLTDVSASVMWEIGLINNAAFSCEYEEEQQGRRIKSRKSETLTVPLTEDSFFSSPVIAGLIGGLSLLICLTLILWFFIKNKKENRLNNFRLSWYWKDSQRPSRTPRPCPQSPAKNPEENTIDVGMTGKFPLNQSCLSISVQKDDDDEINPFQRFATFQSSTKGSKMFSLRQSTYSEFCMATVDQDEYL